MVGLLIRCRIARPRNNGGEENTQPRLNTDSLRDITVQQEFKAALEEPLLPENRYESTIERNALKTKITNCARNILPSRRGNTKSSWFDDECRQVTERKNTAYRAMQQRHRSRACAGEYSRLRREEKRVHRSNKHDLEERNMRELEQTREAYGSTRKFYQAMAGHQNNVIPKVTCCCNKDGDLVSSYT